MSTSTLPAALVAALTITLACGSGGGGKPVVDPPPCTGPDCEPGGVRPPWPQGRPAGYASPIAAENAKAGDSGWRSGRGPFAHEIEGYTDRVTARAGESVGVHVNVSDSHGVTWSLYRVGWYGGAGARRVASGGPVSVAPQPPCPPRATDGLVQCAWARAFQIPIGADLTSGYYAVKLVRADGFIAFAPFVVSDDRPADLLVQASVNTWQAYNAWGGESLYSDDSRKVTGGFALRVSYDRPYAAANGLGAADDHELAFARFLERYGYDVSYTTNLEIARLGESRLVKTGAFLSVGHDEYWAGANRDATERARDAGVPLIFLGANAAYWKVRLEGPGASGEPRIVTCYKSALVTDPISGAEVTGRFRDALVNRPENALVGIAYEGWQILSFPLVVADEGSWLFAGTGLRNGEALPGLVGYEYDVLMNDATQPAGLKVVARSPVVDAEGKPSFAVSTWYRAASGALVFAAGTIQWAQGVDPRRDPYDPRVERMTANVLHEALGLPVPSSIKPGGLVSGGLRVQPNGPFARSVATRAEGLVMPSGVALLPDGGFAAVDPQQHQVFRVSPAGDVSVLAGDGLPGRRAADDGKPGLQARFYYPTAILALPDGSLLVADTGNACIRRIGTDAARTVTTFAGQMNGFGLTDGPAATARFRFPMGLARDPVTGVVYVADSANHRIRAIDAAGNVSTYAGSSGGDADGPGASARFAFPTAVAVGPDRRVYVVASAGATVKAIAADAARTVVTLAGGVQGAADGKGTVALFGAQGGAVWAGSELVIADPASYRLRGVIPGATAADTVVHTIAGTGDFGDAAGTGDVATFGLPLGLAAGADGTIYVADAAHGQIRAVVPP